MTTDHRHFAASGRSRFTTADQEARTSRFSDASARPTNAPAGDGRPTRLLRTTVFAEEALAGRALTALLSRSPSIDCEYAGALRRSPPPEALACHALVWFGDVADAVTFELVGEIRAAHPRMAVCLVAQRVDCAALKALMASDATGVGVILRDAQLDVTDVLRTILQLVSGRVTMAPRVLEELLLDERSRADNVDSLTADEREVLGMLAMGYRNCEIAKRLSRSEKLVERRVARIFTKLGLNDDSCRVMSRRVVAARLFLLRR